MQTIEIQIPEQMAAKILAAAQKLGVTVEQLLQASIEEKLARLDEDFITASSYILEKNADLYQRLA